MREIKKEKKREGQKLIERRERKSTRSARKEEGATLVSCHASLLLIHLRGIHLTSHRVSHALESEYLHARDTVMLD
eukprot:1339428-Amorphochlora_amoeboformis.AAC.2